MLRDLAWQTADTLIRAQITLFRASGDQAGLTANECRRVLELDAGAWAAWVDFLRDGSLPAQPPLPEMLRRLGQATYWLVMMRETDNGAGAKD